MQSFKKLMDGLAALERIVLIITTAVILVLVFGNVLTRKLPFVTASWSFTEELVIALFVLISLLASALCCRDNSHISLALLSMRLNGAAKKKLKIVTAAVGVIYSLLLFWQGYVYTLTEYEGGVRTFVLHWPEWIFCAFVPVSAFCMILHLIENCLDFVNDGAEGGEAK